MAVQDSMMLSDLDDMTGLDALGGGGDDYDPEEGLDTDDLRF
jgi:hypothetical protein